MGGLCSIDLFLGTYHPPPSEEISKLGSTRTVVGIITGLLLLTTFTPSPIFTVDSPFSIDIDSDEIEFFQYPGESNTTSIKIWNNGGEEGWENLSVTIDEIENVTISFTVNFINLSLDSRQINSTSNEFQKYVFNDMANNSTHLNLSSGDYANLTLKITTLDNQTFQDTKFHMKVQSRTEDVYTSTFYLYNREKK